MRQFISELNRRADRFGVIVQCMIARAKQSLLTPRPSVAHRIACYHVPSPEKFLWKEAGVLAGFFVPPRWILVMGDSCGSATELE